MSNEKKTFIDEQNNTSEKNESKNLSWIDLSKEILAKINSVTSNIQGILENSSKFIIDEVDEWVMQYEILNLLKLVLSGNLDKSFLSAYGSEWDINEERLLIKIEKNLLIFTPLIVDFINKDLKILGESTSSEIWKKIINDYIKRFIKWLYLFWDKLDITILKWLFSESKKNMSLLKNNLDKKTSFFDSEEKKHNSLAIDMLNDLVTPNFLKNESLSWLYRTSLKTAYSLFYEKNWNKNLSDDEKNNIISGLLANIIEKEISIVFENQLVLFEKTIETPLNIKNRLEILKISFNKLIFNVKLLSKSNVAFKDIWDNTFDYISDSIYKFTDEDKKDKNIDGFINFLNWNTSVIKTVENLQSKWCFFYNNDNNIIEEDHIDEEIKIITTIEDLLSSKQSDIHYNFTNTVLDFSNWWSELIKNLKISSLKTKADKSRINWFSSVYWLWVWVVENQLYEIQKVLKKWVTLEDFKNSDINNFQFLYNWWRYLLVEKKEKKQKDIIKFYEKEFGVNIWFMKSVWELFEKKWLIEDKDDIKEFTWNISNTSIENVRTYLDQDFKNLAKWNIDLEDYNIWWLNFINDSFLYCWWESDNFENTSNYINNAIDTCFWILQWKTKFNQENQKYLNLLISGWVLNKDLTRTTIAQKNNIMKLVEWLKVIKSKTPSLLEMLKVANNYDRSYIEDIFSDSIISKWNFIESNIASSIWPDKEFWRALIKLIWNYNWDFHKLWDLNRLRINANSIEEMYDNILRLYNIAKTEDRILDIKFDDYIWDLFSISKKDSWYRDLKVDITLWNWNIVELQFHFIEMLKVKNKWVTIEEKHINKLLEEESLLDDRQIIQFCEQYKTKILKWWSKDEKKISYKLLSLISSLSESELKKMNLWDCCSDKWRWEISWDEIYKIRRWISKKKNLYKNLTRLERILFDDAWSEIIDNYINSYTNNENDKPKRKKNRNSRADIS